MNQLPTGWVWTELDKVCTSVTDGDHQPPPQVPAGVPFLVIGNIRDQRLDFTNCRYVSENYFQSLKAIRRPQRGDILYSLVGSYGIPVLVREDAPFCVQRHIGILRPSPQVSAAYLALVMSSREVFDQATQIATGTAQMTVPLSGLRRIRIPIAARAEQDRIVAAIEEQFSRLDAGVAALASVRQKLNRMHASVLRAAVTGRLAGVDRSAGASGLPVGWTMSTPDEIAAESRNALAIGPFGSNLKVSDYVSAGVPLVFVRQVRSGIFGGIDTRFISEDKAKELSAHRIQSGDVLVTKMGEPPGDATVYPDGQPDAVITADVIKLSIREGILPQYVAMAISSQVVRDQFAAITSGVAQQKVSLARFRQSIRIPIPPPEDQVAILNEVTRCKEEMERVDSSIARQLARAGSLRSSVLRMAFLGKLAPQDPAEEPASLLLEQCAAERASSNDHRPARGRKPRRPQEEVMA